MLIGIGVVLLLVAAGIFIWAQLGYRQAAETYSNLTQYVTVDSEGDGIPVVDWDALKAQNEDIVAWIYVPGTDISYPVVQGETNDEYLRTLPDGTWNNNGSIMLDCDQTAPGMVDQQTTVYGHHMNDGSMFQPIEQTLDQANFDAMDTVYYLTPDATYKLTPLFAARVEESYVEARQANFGDTAALQQYLTDLRSYAQAEASDVDERLSQTEQVLSLVTCSGMAPADHRAVMVCTIAEETPAAGASSAVEWAVFLCSSPLERPVNGPRGNVVASFGHLNAGPRSRSRSATSVTCGFPAPGARSTRALSDEVPKT